jgi:hypothetical protein
MDHFFLVPTVVAAVKYLDISLNEIERILREENGEFNFDWEHVVEDEFNNEITVVLKLNISCQQPMMVGWSIALKMHRTRIDGIDWHNAYFDPHGDKQHGWHRHEFDQNTKSANNRRVPTAALDSLTCQREFLIWTLKEMKFILNRVDYGNYELFGDQGVPGSPPE